MKVKSKLLKSLCALAVVVAQVSVNSTCHFRYYQDELSPTMNSLRKYNAD